MFRRLVCLAVLAAVVLASTLAWAGSPTPLGQPVSACGIQATLTALVGDVAYVLVENCQDWPVSGFSLAATVGGEGVAPTRPVRLHPGQSQWLMFDLDRPADSPPGSLTLSCAVERFGVSCPLTVGTWHLSEAPMSVTFGTGGYVRKNTSNTLTYTLPKGTLVSARVKLRGVSVSGTSTVASQSATLSWPTEGLGTSKEWWSLIRPTYTRILSGADPYIHVYRQVSGYNDIWYASNQDYGVSGTVWARYELDWTNYSVDPHVHVNGGATAVGYTGTLGSGVETAWYDLTGLVLGASNTITVNVSSSYVVDVWVEIVIIPALTVTLEDPTSGESVARNELVFRLSAVKDPDCTDTVWWPRIQANQTDTWTSPEIDVDSRASQVGWQYSTDGGLTWAALPAGGAPVTAKVRYTPPVPSVFATKRYWWRGASWDGDIADWGDWSSSVQIRVMLAVTANFAVEINAVDASSRVEHLQVELRKNGGLSNVTFDLQCRDDATEPAPASGATVDVSIRDGDANQVQYNGWVEGTPDRAGPGYRHVYVALHDSRLAQRVCTADVASQDVGLTLKQLIDTYCPELDSSGVNTALGLSRPVQCIGKTVMDVFREVSAQVGADFWVDSSVVPPKVYVVKWADMPPAQYALLFGRATLS